MKPIIFSTEMIRIDEIQERCEATTVGPWRMTIANLIVDGNGRALFHGDGAKANATFIAHAREDVPWLIDAVKERDEEIDRLCAALKLSQARAKGAEAERDAAVRDIERVLAYEDGDNGWLCAYCKPEHNCVTDEKCIPKWRGIQAATGAAERSGEE